MDELKTRISELENQMEKLTAPQELIWSKIHEYETLLNKEKEKLKEEVNKVKDDEKQISNELIPLMWVKDLLENKNDKCIVLLNDRCLGEKRKFFEALRVIPLSEINNVNQKSDVPIIKTGIGKYLSQIREKYIIDVCFLKVLYETDYFCIAEEDDEHEFDDEPQNIRIYKKKQEIECNIDNINFDEILNYYSKHNKHFIHGNGNSDGIWNELNLDLRCWSFTLKE